MLHKCIFSSNDKADWYGSLRTCSRNKDCRCFQVLERNCDAILDDISFKGSIVCTFLIHSRLFVGSFEIQVPVVDIYGHMIHNGLMAPCKVTLQYKDNVHF